MTGPRLDHAMTVQGLDHAMTVQGLDHATTVQMLDHADGKVTVCHAQQLGREILRVASAGPKRKCSAMLCLTMELSATCIAEHKVMKS